MISSYSALLHVFTLAVLLFLELAKLGASSQVLARPFRARLSSLVFTLAALYHGVLLPALSKCHLMVCSPFFLANTTWVLFQGNGLSTGPGSKFGSINLAYL